MEIMLALGLAITFALALCFAVVWYRERDFRNAERAAAEQRNTALNQQISSLKDKIEAQYSQIDRLSKWSHVADADDKAREIIQSAQSTLRQAQSDAAILVSNAENQYTTTLERAQADAERESSEAREAAKQMRADAKSALDAAASRVSAIIEEANRRADEIAGKAYDVVRDAERYEQTAKAMKNAIEGYGDRYLVPAENLLDELAEDYSHKQAGRDLKAARQLTKAIGRPGVASRCEYVEPNRREAAEAFALYAFEGKVDAIMARVRHDNVGTLEQEIMDAFHLVNHNGSAFRDARITDEYREARVQELRLAATVQELRRQEREEQRRIREQIREEEKARREYERAMREAAKEEDMLRKAMAKAQARADKATEEQRAEFEQQLAELNARLKEAEERGQRAVSMAQQTRRGHVYIISNVGSFGEEVFKIGLTRRLEPLDRVKELGDSSVPFDFDVHAMIMSEDAPALENQLHKHFVLKQVNKVNHRKEFFRASLSEIRTEIERLGIEAKWTMAAEAIQFRETIAIERAIESDPGAKDAWLSRQLSMDPVDYDEMAAAIA